MKNETQQYVKMALFLIFICQKQAEIEKGRAF